MTGTLSAADTTFRQTLLQSDAAAERIAARHERRRRLRLLVDHTDELVAACEAAHLGDSTRASDELVAQVREMLREASAALPGRRGADTRRALADRGRPPTAPLIRQLMDLIWTVQGATFDELLPWRCELGDNDDDAMVPSSRPG